MEIESYPIPPYLASTQWFQNKGQRSILKTRVYTRALIESNSPDGMTLTVPVVGGNSAIKRFKPEELAVSGHGDWTRIHLGAIEAAYGREPYFLYLFPDIASIIANYPEHLSTLNVMLVKRMLDFIDYDIAIDDIGRLRRENPDRCSAITHRIELKINPGHSFLEPLFRLGPDSIFLL